MYTSLAAVYDRLMDDIDYPAWARRYAQLLDRSGCRPATLCECACGTGSLTVELAKWGVKLTASDLSPEMLEVAAEKLRRAGTRAPLICQDMRALSLPRRVDAVLSCCDGANYLTDKDGLSAFLRSAFAALKEGGALAFDISTVEKLAAMDGQVFCDERDDVACIWKTRWNENALELKMDVSLYLRQPGGLYKRLSEEHRQKGWPVEKVLSLMEEAGFTSCAAYGEKGFGKPEPGCQRVYFTGLRP